MQVVRHYNYVPVERTLDQAIQEKIKVLKEFYVVDNRNEETIKQQLIDAVNAEPNKNFDIVIDRVAHTLIQRKLSDL